MCDFDPVQWSQVEYMFGVRGVFISDLGIQLGLGIVL